jgi:hypothetical protein
MKHHCIIPFVGYVLLFAMVGASVLSAQVRELTPAEQKAADMRMPSLDRSALEPEKREPAQVRETERNPFGLVSLPPATVEETETIEAETEEQRLRRIVGNMRISGLSGSPGSYCLLLGSMTVREGDKLPKLFADQAEVLHVSKITEREVVLTFQEKDPTLPPRSMSLGYNLQPRPQSLLPGEIFRKLVPFTAKGAPDLKPLEVPAVKSIVDGAEEGGLQGWTDRSREMLGEPEGRNDEPANPPQN